MDDDIIRLTVKYCYIEIDEKSGGSQEETRPSQADQQSLHSQPAGQQGQQASRLPRKVHSADIARPTNKPIESQQSMPTQPPTFQTLKPIDSYLIKTEYNPPQQA